MARFARALRTTVVVVAGLIIVIWLFFSAFLRLLCFYCSPPVLDAVAVDHSGTLYAAIRGDQAVSVIAQATSKIVSVVPVPVQVSDLIMDSSNDYLYVLGWEPQRSRYEDTPRSQMVAIIDTIHGTQVGTTVVPRGNETHPVKTPDSRSTSGGFHASPHPYVAELIDASTGKRVLLPLGNSPGNEMRSVTAISPSGARVYVAEMSSKPLEEQWLPGGGSQKITELLRGEILIVAHDAIAGRVSIFEETLSGGGLNPGFAGLAANRADTRVYLGVRLSHSGFSFIAVIDASHPAAPRVVGRIPLDFSPTGLSLDPSETRLYVAQTDFGGGAQRGTLSVIDTRTYQILSVVAVGREPTKIAVQPSGARVYVANSGSGTLSVVDTSAHHVVATIKIREERPITFGD